jgi:hypothetical protein
MAATATATATGQPTVQRDARPSVRRGQLEAELAPVALPTTVGGRGRRRGPDLVVLSRMRWNDRQCRARQLLSRLAPHWRILFIEEPVWGMGPPTVERRDEGPDVTVLVPHSPVCVTGFDSLPHLTPLLRQHFRSRRVQRPVLWIDSLDALPLARTFGPRVLVYDCPGDTASLAALLGPRDATDPRATALLQEASLVLAALESNPHTIEAMLMSRPSNFDVRLGADLERNRNSMLAVVMRAGD